MDTTTGNSKDLNCLAGDNTLANKDFNTTITNTHLPLHGLDDEQLAKLYTTVNELETHLLHCVDDVREERWALRPRLKIRAELHLRALLGVLATRLKVKPMTEVMRLHRNDLLTRRIRRVLRVFSEGPRSYSHGAVPDITWDETIAPKSLYPNEDLTAAREERDFAKEEEVLKEEQRLQEERQANSKAAKQMREEAERARKILAMSAKIKKREEEEKERERKEQEERKTKEDEERKRKEEEEERKRKEEEEARKRKEKEEEDRKRKEEEEEDRKRKEEEERRRKEEEEKRRKEEAERKIREQAEKEEERRQEDKDEEEEEEEEQEKTKQSTDGSTNEEERAQRAGTLDRKGKGKEVAHETTQPHPRKEPKNPKTAFVDVPAAKQGPPGRKRPRKEYKSKETVEDTDEEAEQDNPSVVQAPKKKRKTASDPVGSKELLPCDRCVLGKVQCHPNGYRKACVSCRTSKQTCSHSKLMSSSSGLPAPQPPPRPSAVDGPPAPNAPPGPDSQQIVKVKRKRAPDDAGEAGSSKLPKVRIPASVAAEPASRRKVTPSAEGERLIAQGSQSDVALIFRRLDAQDKRIRELEASESVIGKSMAKKTYVDEAIADVVHNVEKQTQALENRMQGLENRHSETRKRVTVMADNTVRALTERFEGLETKFEQVGSTIDELSSLPGALETLQGKFVGMVETLDHEDKRRDEENRGMEQQWAKDLTAMETRLEEKIDENYQEQDRKLLEKESANVANFNSHVQESLKQLHTEIKQDWWIAELERREEVRSDQMKLLLQQRPTYEEVAKSYTSIDVTSQLIDKVGDLHKKTGRQHHLLQSGLNTLERLFLRQLDSSAEMVDPSEQLQDILHRQVLQPGPSNPPHSPPPVVIAPDNISPTHRDPYHPAISRAPPRMQRAMSVPPSFACGSVPARTIGGTVRADVTMADDSGNNGAPMEVERQELIGYGIVSHTSSPSPSHDHQSPSPVRTRSRTRALQPLATVDPLPPVQEDDEVMPGVPFSSPLTSLSDLGLSQSSPAKSTPGKMEKVMSEYINYDMTS